MTLDQRRQTKQALMQYRTRGFRHSLSGRKWAAAIDRTVRYYDAADPLRAQLLRVRYFEGRTIADTQEQLNIGYSTYQKANSDVLSTLAIHAAHDGLL